MNPKRCFDAEYSVEHSESWRNEGCNEVILSKETRIDYSDSEDNFPRKVWELLEIWSNLLSIVAQLQDSGAAWSRCTAFFHKVKIFIEQKYKKISFFGGKFLLNFFGAISVKIIRFAKICYSVNIYHTKPYHHDINLERFPWFYCISVKFQILCSRVPDDLGPDTEDVRKMSTSRESELSTEKWAFIFH